MTSKKTPTDDRDPYRQTSFDPDDGPKRRQQPLSDKTTPLPTSVDVSAGTRTRRFGTIALIIAVVASFFAGGLARTMLETG